MLRYTPASIGTSNMSNKQQDLPIGIFDSGMGGLTILRELKQQLPNESFIYLGDTARLPYGTKGSETVIQYAMQMARILIKRKVKCLVVACNTATAAALSYLQEQFPDLPILGVIEPGAKAALLASQNKHIAVIATESTIASNAYQQCLLRLAPDTQVLNIACNLFVALAEEACINNEISHATIRYYLSEVINTHCDTIVLGCTHFPVLKTSIQDFLGDISIIDSASVTAQTVKSLLEEHALQTNQTSPELGFLVTDLPTRFIRIGQLFLGDEINPGSVHLVDVFDGCD